MSHKGLPVTGHMRALRTLVDQALSVGHVVAHPVLEVGVGEMAQQQLATLKAAFAEWTGLPIAPGHTPHLIFFQHRCVERVGPPHLLVEDLDGHLMGDAPVANQRHLIRIVFATERTCKRWHNW